MTTVDSDIEKLSPIQYEIVAALCDAVTKLGGSRGLLACLGSWGDTLPQEQILQMLQELNATD